jgi:hypothetical protein
MNLKLFFWVSLCPRVSLWADRLRALVEPNKEGRKAREKGRFRPVCDSFLKAEGTGIEPTAYSSEKQGAFKQGNAKCNAVADKTEVTDEDRASFRIVAIAWPRLTQKDKQKILAIIRRALDSTHDAKNAPVKQLGAF